MSNFTRRAIAASFFCFVTALASAQSVNDDCASAITIDADTPVSGSLAGAGVSTVPDCFGKDVDGGFLYEIDTALRVVWYRYVAPATVSGLQISLCSEPGSAQPSKQSHGIGVYRGGCAALDCAGGSEIAQSNPVCTSSPGVQWPAEAGEEYLIGIYSVNASEQVFTLKLTSITVPDNDACNKAVLLDPQTTEVIGTNVGATAEDIDFPNAAAYCGSPAPFAYDDLGVWYAFDVTPDAPFTISVAESSFRESLALLSGTCEALTCEREYNLGNEISSGSLQANRRYFIYVEGFTGERGIFTLKIAPAAPGFTVTYPDETQQFGDLVLTSVQPTLEQAMTFAADRYAEMSGSFRIRNRNRFTVVDNMTGDRYVWADIVSSDGSATLTLFMDPVFIGGTPHRERIVVRAGNYAGQRPDFSDKILQLKIGQ